MADSPSVQRWIGRAQFAGCVLALMFLHLMPLKTLPSTWAAPDFMLALTIAWTARRPDLLPIWSVALCFFLADLLFGRPPGLWTALVLILTEMIRARAADLRSAPFTLEWMTFAAAITAITMINRAVLAVVMTPQAPLGLTLLQMVATIVAYPAVVLISHLIFGISRPAPGETDSRGQKI